MHRHVGDALVVSELGGDPFEDTGEHLVLAGFNEIDECSAHIVDVVRCGCLEHREPFVGQTSERASPILWTFLAAEVAATRQAIDSLRKTAL